MVSYKLLASKIIGQPISEVKIDLGMLYRVGKITFFNSGSGAEWSRQIYHCIKSCPECLTADYILLLAAGGGNTNYTWTGDINTRCVKGIVSYTYGSVELKVYELLYASSITISSNKNKVAYPDNQFTVSGNVKDQYNTPIVGQTVNIEVSKDGTVYFSGTVTTDSSGNYTKTISTATGQTLWPAGVYTVKATADSAVQSLNIETYYSGILAINATCADTGAACPADVYIDNIFAGTTPITATLPIGDHSYRISRAGYVDVTGVQTVQFLITSTVNAVLNRPANITATGISVSPAGLCGEPCAKSVTVMWTNTGGVPGTLVPAIIVDGTRHPLAETLTLNPGDVIARVFTVSNLLIGVHIICPDPN